MPAIIKYDFTKPEYRTDTHMINLVDGKPLGRRDGYIQFVEWNGTNMIFFRNNAAIINENLSSFVDGKFYIHTKVFPTNSGWLFSLNDIPTLLFQILPAPGNQYVIEMKNVGGSWDQSNLLTYTFTSTDKIFDIIVNYSTKKGDQTNIYLNGELLTTYTVEKDVSPARGVLSISSPRWSFFTGYMEYFEYGDGHITPSLTFLSDNEDNIYTYENNEFRILGKLNDLSIEQLQGRDIVLSKMTGDVLNSFIKNNFKIITLQRD